MQKSILDRSMLEKLVKQKLLRKAVMAKNQLARRTARQKDREERDQRKTDRENNFFTYRQKKNIILAERKARREDWELGPLAPKRDVGDRKDTYGAVDGQLIRGPKLSKEEAEEKMKDFGGKFLSLFKGDRVVLLEGRDKGKIGKVISIDKERAECTVEGLNLIDVKVPQWMRDAEPNDKRAVRTIEKGISIASVRLVYPLTDEETGITRDVIIKRLVNGPIFHDKTFRTTRWARIIPGYNIRIPWPKKEPPVHEDHDVDTFRLDVDIKNFVPTLLTPPMPPSVIDELRNKYSKFRTRHDADFIEKKMLEQAPYLEMQKNAALMRTPLKEANRLQRKLRKAKGKGDLTPYTLERIGAVIAKAKGLTIHEKEPDMEATLM
ncbi:putative kow domain-containing protein domain-containing protein [Golovinomyces cichoracearum]|uniref:Putative kow domain-containing protein domain-containing protein n=1 Tax=Golovinomyces cichoracearum TaxID=62708 RepID=A0A420IV02_9PEZI|nr:putative kow domain-containing protein domain-containing protein [Golovinomyces cichoracearum]